MRTCVPFSFSSSQSKQNTWIYGWAAGLGVDFLILPNLFLRAEYEYVAFTTIDGIKAGINTAAHRRCLEVLRSHSPRNPQTPALLTAWPRFRMSGGRRPLPTEWRLSERIDHDDARHAAVRAALLLRSLRQAPRLEPASPHRRRPGTFAPVEDRQGEAQALDRPHS